MAGDKSVGCGLHRLCKKKKNRPLTVGFTAGLIKTLIRVLSIEEY